MCAAPAPAVACTTPGARADGIYVFEAGDSRKDSRRRWRRVHPQSPGSPLLYPCPRAAAAGLRHPRSHRRSARPSSGCTYHTFCRCHCHARVLRRVAHRRGSKHGSRRSCGGGPGPSAAQRRYQSDRIGCLMCLGNAPLALARWARPLELWS